MPSELSVHELLNSLPWTGAPFILPTGFEELHICTQPQIDRSPSRHGLPRGKELEACRSREGVRMAIALGRVLARRNPPPDLLVSNETPSGQQACFFAALALDGAPQIRHRCLNDLHRGRALLFRTSADYYSDPQQEGERELRDALGRVGYPF